MGVLEFIATMTAALAWPAAFIGFCIVFRKPVASLLGKLETIGFGGAEAKFKQKLDQAESAAVQLPAEPPALGLDSPGTDRGPPIAEPANEPLGDTTEAEVPPPSAIWPDNLDIRARHLVPSLMRFESIAQTSPAAAIIDLWQDIDRAIRAVAAKRGVQVQSSTQGLVTSLALRGVFSTSLVDLIRILNDLRDEASHEAHRISVTDAIRFRENALVAATSLARALNTTD